MSTSRLKDLLPQLLKQNFLLERSLSVLYKQIEFNANRNTPYELQSALNEHIQIIENQIALNTKSLELYKQNIIDTESERIDKLNDEIRSLIESMRLNNSFFDGMGINGDIEIQIQLKELEVSEIQADLRKVLISVDERFEDYRQLLAKQYPPLAIPSDSESETEEYVYLEDPMLSDFFVDQNQIRAQTDSVEPFENEAIGDFSNQNSDRLIPYGFFWRDDGLESSPYQTWLYTQVNSNSVK